MSHGKATRKSATGPVLKTGEHNSLVGSTPAFSAKTHNFTFVIDYSHMTIALADKVYGKCDDCIVTSRDKKVLVEFDRKAPTRLQAIMSAKRDLERCGITVKEIL